MRYVIREKFFRLAEDSVVQDEQGAPIYQVKGKIFSLHHTLVLMDLAGDELATVNKQIISMTPKFHITRHGEEAATVRKKLISPFVDRFTVDIPGLTTCMSQEVSLSTTSR